jgi:hypothetical protein
MDYGVCRGTDPKCFHDWPRAKTGIPLKVLLYTRTAGPGTPTSARPWDRASTRRWPTTMWCRRACCAWRPRTAWTLDYTEDVSQMQRLVGYNAVIFFSTSRDNLDDGAKTALRQYIRAGGGFVGIHNAFGTLYNWPYYEGLLGGANFYDHGPTRTARW